jgi:peroxiredoxin family protein
MSEMTPEMEKLIDQRVQEALKNAGVATQKNRMALIASQGTLDMAYPPLIIASTAAAMEMETAIFFTFYGLYILHKKRGTSLQVPPLANPGMPIPIPNIIGALPGMTAMATSMMKSWMGKVKVPTVPQLLEMCVESGVRIIACQMTMDVMGIKREDLIDQIEVGGAATFLGYAAESSINMYM